MRSTKTALVLLLIGTLICTSFPFAPLNQVVEGEAVAAATLAQTQEEMTFRVTIENISGDSVQPSPLSPGAWAVHDPDVNFFTVGTPASPGLATVAEDGDPATLQTELASTEGVSNSGVFNTPVGAGGPGPLPPGGSYEFEFTAPMSTNLSFASMFVQSNDVFIAPDGDGIPLFDANGMVLPARDITSDLSYWDAGSEVNEAPGLGPNQAPRQPSANSGAAEGAVAPFTNATRTLPLAPGIADVSVMHESGTMTVTVENVSATSGAISTTISPVFYATHNNTWNLFNSGESPSTSLETLAEDGDPGDLLTLYAGPEGEGTGEFGAENTPVGGVAGPAASGQSYVFSVTLDLDHPYLTLATMIVETNDVFLAFDPAGIRLFNDLGTPRSAEEINADIARALVAWDAGTEANEVPGAGPNQPVRQPAPNTGPIDPNTVVRVYNDSTSDLDGPGAGGFADVTITNVGGLDFRVDVTNTSDAANYPYRGLLTPVVWAVHDNSARFFTAGEPASEGLERVAEDGITNTLVTALQGLSGVDSAGAAGDAPIPPGATQSFTVTMSGDHPTLSIASMVVPSNDTFLAFTSTGINLATPLGTPRPDVDIAADIATQLQMWDAGTERNQAGAAGPDQPPRQAGANTGADEGDGNVRALDNPDPVWHYPPIEDVVRVTLIPEVESTGPGAVFVATNSADGNEIVMYDRDANGSLRYISRYPTGGTGSGVGLTVPIDPLGSQGSLAISGDYLFAVNAGSNEISVMRIGRDGLTLVDTFDSGGIFPVSLTIYQRVLYVLNAGGDTDTEANITGFRIRSNGTLTPLAGSTRNLGAATNPPNILQSPGQVGFSPDGDLLAVTDKANNQILTFPVGVDGLPSVTPVENAAQNDAPFSFVFDNRGNLLVTEAAVGAVSSYSVAEDGVLTPIDTQETGQQATCWIAGYGNYYYTSNTTSGTLSGFQLGPNSELTLLEGGVSADPGAGSLPIDITVTRNGEYLYALNAGSRTIGMYGINSSTGSLTSTMQVANVLPADASPAGIVAYEFDIEEDITGSVFVATNAADGNEVIRFNRRDDGSLSYAGVYDTGGNGSGAGTAVDPLGSQGSLIVDGNWLFVVNAGSDTVSSFRIERDSLSLVDTVDSGGDYPVSLDVHQGLLYVLNAGGEGNLTGFRIEDDGQLSQVATRSLLLVSNTSPPTTSDSPGQVGFNPTGTLLAVTLKAQNLVRVYTVNPDGTLVSPQDNNSAGDLPFSFVFDGMGNLVVTEVLGSGETPPTNGAASYYEVGNEGRLSTTTASVGNDQTATCWVVYTGNYFYTSNTVSNTISSYNVNTEGDLVLADAVATQMITGSLPIDMALANRNNLLYVLNAGSRSIGGLSVNQDGSLTQLGGQRVMLTNNAIQGIATYDFAMDMTPVGAVFVATNEVSGNAVLMFNRQPNGWLHFMGEYATGGQGAGPGTEVPVDPLGSQNSLIIRGRWLYVVNARSDTISVFRIERSGLTLLQTVPSNGSFPVSLTAYEDWLYVLNAGSNGNISGFEIGDDGRLTAIGGAIRVINTGEPAERPNILRSPAQISFSPDGRSLVVTEKGSNEIHIFGVDTEGVPSAAPQSLQGAGSTPFSFTFNDLGHLLVTEAGNPDVNNDGAVTSYRLTPGGGLQAINASLPLGQDATCWIVSDGGSFAYASNTASNSISGLRVDANGSLSLVGDNGIVAQVGTDSAPIDLALTSQGQYLYSVNAGNDTIGIFAPDPEAPASGALTSLGNVRVFPPVPMQGIATYDFVSPPPRFNLFSARSQVLAGDTVAFTATLDPAITQFNAVEFNFNDGTDPVRILRTAPGTNVVAASHAFAGPETQTYVVSATLSSDLFGSGVISDAIEMQVLEVPTAESIELEVQDTTLVADGVSTAIITATVFDEGNQLMADQLVTFETDLGTVTPISSTSNITGLASTTFTAGLITGTTTITATSADAVATAEITLAAPGEPARVEVTAADRTIQTGETTTITATVLDANDAIVSGREVSFTLLASNATLEPMSGRSNVDGTVVATLTPSEADLVTVEAMASSVRGTTSVLVRTAGSDPVEPIGNPVVQNLSSSDDTTVTLASSEGSNFGAGSQFLVPQDVITGATSIVIQEIAGPSQNVNSLISPSEGVSRTVLGAFIIKLVDTSGNEMMGDLTEPFTATLFYNNAPAGFFDGTVGLYRYNPDTGTWTNANIQRGNVNTSIRSVVFGIGHLSEFALTAGNQRLFLPFLAR